MAHGSREAYHADPLVFEKRWGVAPTSWWGSQSWERKYRQQGNYFHERSALLTPFSDHWHASAIVSKTGLIGGTFLVTIGEKRPISAYLCRAGLVWLVHAGAASLTYKILRR